MDEYECLRRVRPELKQWYYKGNLDLLGENRVRLAIVGSRHLTDYGKRIIERWVPELVKRKIVITSGFMYGADMVAHRSCVESGGQTIAVLGWGIERKLGGRDGKMYQKLVEEGSLILSEYGENEGAEKWRFPQRNRIVAGMSDAVLVVEAALKSGSLITAEWARKMSVPVLAVPGEIGKRYSEGTNQLISSGRAKLVTGVNDILEILHIKGKQMEMKFQISDPIVDLLKAGGLTGEEIAVKMRLTGSDLNVKLMNLVMEGMIEERGGRYFLM